MALTPANPTAFNTLLFSCAVNASYVFLSALPIVFGSGCRAEGPPDLTGAEERDVDEVGVAVGARLGAIVRECRWVCEGRWWFLAIWIVDGRRGVVVEGGKSFDGSALGRRDH